MHTLLAFPMSALILGVVNIAIVVAVLIIVGLLIVWFMSWMGKAPPEQLKNAYLILVALIGLYMLLGLIFGLPVPSILGR
jgi:hypothetical protein